MKVMKWKQFKKAMKSKGNESICTSRLTFRPECRSFYLTHEMAVVSFYNESKDTTYLWVKDKGMFWIFDLSDDEEGICFKFDGKLSTKDLSGDKYVTIYSFLYWQSQLEMLEESENDETGRERLKKEKIVYLPVKGMKIRTI